MSLTIDPHGLPTARRPEPASGTVKKANALTNNGEVVDEVTHTRANKIGKKITTAIHSTLPVTDSAILLSWCLGEAYHPMRSDVLDDGHKDDTEPFVESQELDAMQRQGQPQGESATVVIHPAWSWQLSEPQHTSLEWSSFQGRGSRQVGA